MTYLRVINERTGHMLGDRVALADQWWSRLRGLLGRPPLRSGEGLLLTPCRAVHMHGMGYALDVLMLDSAGQIVALYEGLQPGARTRWHSDAVQTLELPEGAAALAECALGDALVLLPCSVHPVRGLGILPDSAQESPAMPAGARLEPPHGASEAAA